MRLFFALRFDVDRLIDNSKKAFSSFNWFKQSRFEDF